MPVVICWQLLTGHGRLHTVWYTNKLRLIKCKAQCDHYLITSGFTVGDYERSWFTVCSAHAQFGYRAYLSPRDLLLVAAARSVMRTF